MEETILQVSGLVTTFETEAGRVRAVDDVSFNLAAGRVLGLVGESGCGKTVTALSIMRLLPKPAGQIVAGEIRFRGRDLVSLPAAEMHDYRGKKISMIFQEPMTALNPVHRIGRQVEEVFQLHFPRMGASERRAAALDMLEKVGISDPRVRMKEYPHQMSGGMRQRVMIAMALACKPDILIADEPTTALDATIQAQILELIRQLQAETGMSVLFITHALGVVAEMCDQVVVFYAGRVAESASVDSLFRNPLHPYTQGLLDSIPRLETPGKMRLNTIRGMVPALDEMPEGCRFRNRCPRAMPICGTRQPPMKTVGGDHGVSCYLY